MVFSGRPSGGTTGSLGEHGFVEFQIELGAALPAEVLLHTGTYNLLPDFRLAVVAKCTFNGFQQGWCLGFLLKLNPVAVFDSIVSGVVSVTVSASPPVLRTMGTVP